MLTQSFLFPPKSSQISSVTESESEAEEPLAESSASYFSGYEHSSNTPKHQADTADVQSQGSIVEPLDSLAQVQQEAVTAESLSSSVVASIAREPWSEETEAQVTQPDLPPVMPAQAPEPPHPSYYSSSPPLNQPSFGQVKSQQPETVQTQHVYGSQWTEPAQVDEAQQVEPIQPRGTGIFFSCLDHDLCFDKANHCCYIVVIILFYF